MDIEVKENQYETEQELMKLINLEEEIGVFEFDFKTDKELTQKQRTNLEFEYKCIRVHLIYNFKHFNINETLHIIKGAKLVLS